MEYALVLTFYCSLTSTLSIRQPKMQSGRVRRPRATSSEVASQRLQRGDDLVRKQYWISRESASSLSIDMPRKNIKTTPL